MPRPVIGNTNGSGASYSGTASGEPIVKVPTGETITICSAGWDFNISDTSVKIVNRSNKKTVLSINKSEIIIGNESGEHIKLKA